MSCGCRLRRLSKLRSLPGAALLLAAAANLGAQDAAAPTADAASPASAVLIDLQQAVRHVAESVTPSVVKLDTVAAGRDRDSRPSLMPVPGVGSGVLVRRDADRHFILTNYHVVRSAERIVVTLSDERSFPGEVVGADPRMDLAMVAVRAPDELPLAVLGDSDTLRAGDLVLTVGSPFGLDATLTLGIVSAVGRSGGEVNNISSFIQTDATMNPGSSGGALVDIAGRVVGINTWIQAQGSRWAGIGFALPINNAKRVIDQLIEDGSVSYAWLGVVLAGPDIVEYLTPGGSGAVLFDLYDGEPAQRAGLRPGDVVLEVAGREVADSDDLISAIVALEPGQPARFRLMRDGIERAVVVWPGSGGAAARNGLARRAGPVVAGPDGTGSGGAAGSGCVRVQGDLRQCRHGVRAAAPGRDRPHRRRGGPRPA